MKSLATFFIFLIIDQAQHHYIASAPEGEAYLT